MLREVTPAMRDPKTPPDVMIRAEARRPETDPTLGIAVNVNRQGTPRHRLVAIGDSLTQGFQSGAIFNTSLSYPRLIASELGWAEFRYPTYGGPGDGLPINLEWLARQLEQSYGDKIDWWEFAPALLTVRDLLDRVEDYWERGAGSIPPDPYGRINHNLGVYGWDLRNTLSKTADRCRAEIQQNSPRDNFTNQGVQNANEISALRVLNSARNDRGQAFPPLDAAQALAAEGTLETGDGDGIETLIVMIGANNALGSILQFNVSWSGDDYDSIEQNNQYTVWRPIHFEAEWNQVVEQIKQIRARHVIISTVPHVTIAPLARGVDRKVVPGSRYYPYYTLPWITDQEFNPDKHPHLTEQQARAIDSAIDQYNDCIANSVRQARQEGRDWYLFELVSLLDRVALRRYVLDPTARPSWWDEVGGAYELPAPLQALNPVPDSRFFVSDRTGRKQGGLFSLDGIHPTTIGYGIMAQEIIRIMQIAGVQFYQSNGTPRSGDVEIDFNRLIQLDTLIANPPKSISNDLSLIGWLDSNFNLISRTMRSMTA
ncbi:SGNH/GDSL hydrolase family protein [Leptolyngbya ohadii]|uniref:SGNH/GDSL hydrolase family protein n=1 Tax=Leptolyngbya ohadii TaxID=1962290 RepID=UPI000B59AE73|nr:SGNH/GDSL hydrolase family protein [Leptolyngbya ohadii]